MATTKDESNARIFHALRGNSKSITLDNCQLKKLPAAIVRLKSLRSLSAKNNKLTDHDGLLLKNFTQLTTVNLGGNHLSTVPSIPSSPIVALHLFNNHIVSIDHDSLKDFETLRVLNLNNNLLETIPHSINILTQLVVLSLAHNQLWELPKEICQLQSLRELHLEDNKIESLPQDIMRLKRLETLYVQKNELMQVPESLGRCTRLRSLDMSRNRIQIFPYEIKNLKLEEFHFEQNPLIPPVPLPSDQAGEVLPLKELVSRYLLCDTVLEEFIQSNAKTNELLSRVGTCAVCNGPFVYSWLDCVEFIDSRTIFRLNHRGQILPLRAVLCSYACFNKDHNFYGIAIPPDYDKNTITPTVN